MNKFVSTLVGMLVIVVEFVIFLYFTLVQSTPPELIDPSLFALTVVVNAFLIFKITVDNADLVKVGFLKETPIEDRLKVAFRYVVSLGVMVILAVKVAEGLVYLRVIGF